MKNKVLIVIGSKSDQEVLKDATGILDDFGVRYDLVVASAHRQPDKVHELAKGAEENYDVIIAAAGKAAALPGVVAAYTVLPVIGIPIKTSDLGGLDSLYSIVQMPAGIPVATVGINNAKNAALLAIHIMGVADQGIRKKLHEYRVKLREGN